MKKKSLFTLCIALVLLLALPAYFLFFSKVTEKTYNRIMCYYIARSFTDNANNFDDKVRTLRDFVHENVHPVGGYYNRLDTCAVEKLTSGIGWCDQQARVFMQLARSQGITTRLLFLRLESGSSPHTIAEALAPDGRWVIVDVGNKLELINKDGNPATQSDIKEDLGIIAENRRVMLRAKFEERWSDPGFLSIYSNPPTYVTTKEGVKFDFLKFLPLRVIKPIVNIINDRYLNQITPVIKDIYEFKMIKARTRHLLGYYESSEKLYDEAILNSDNLPLVRKAEFYKAVLLKDQERYEETHVFIENVINKDKDNPYIQYLRGLRARILEKLGRFGEAEMDLIEIKYSLET